MFGRAGEGCGLRAARTISIVSDYATSRVRRQEKVLVLFACPEFGVFCEPVPPIAPKRPDGAGAGMGMCGRAGMEGGFVAARTISIVSDNATSRVRGQEKVLVLFEATAPIDIYLLEIVLCAHDGFF